jgi:hypothetical protein
MAIDIASAPQTAPLRAVAEEEKDILYLIGRALIDHKERLYTCHLTGFTAELAWPIMESILGNIRPYLRSVESDGGGFKLLPAEPTAEMVSAALQASIRVQHQFGYDIRPDSPGNAPSEMVRAVWAAMMQALPEPIGVHEKTLCPAAQLPAPVMTPIAGPVGYGDADVRQPLRLLSRAGQMLKSRTHSLVNAAARGWHSSKHKDVLARH